MMKQSVFTGLSTVLFLFFIAGCQKETRTSQTGTTENKLPTKQQDLRMWWDSGREPGFEGVDYGCEGIGGNCLPDAVVTPKLASLLIDFAQSTNSGSFASIHYTNLSKVIDTKILDDVIDRKLTVSMRGQIETGKTAYLKFSSENGAIITVYPLKK
ncbi:hypothetical protein D3C71_852680 [compost metagenome]